MREFGQDLNPFAEAERIGAWIEHLRKQRFPSPEERKTAQKAAGPAKKQAQELKEKFEGLVKALRSTKVSREFAGTSLAEFVVFLRKACGVDIAIDPVMRAVQAERPKLSNTSLVVTPPKIIVMQKIGSPASSVPIRATFRLSSPA